MLFLLPHAQAFQALLFAQLVLAVRVVLHQEGGRLRGTLLAVWLLAAALTTLAAITVAAAPAPAATLAALAAFSVAGRTRLLVLLLRLRLRLTLYR